MTAWQGALRTSLLGARALGCVATVPRHDYSFYPLLGASAAGRARAFRR